MKFGVLGGGFGIYGYIPAIFNNGWDVLTLEKYRDNISERKELLKYQSAIEYAADDSSLIKRCNSLVVARDPNSQVRTIKSLGNFKGWIFLEKPLAPKVSQHEEMLNFLETRDFSIAYLFPFTKWYELLVEKVLKKEISKILITWEVLPKESNWKWEISKGGGLCDFYGVHFVKLIDHLNISMNSLTCEASKGKIEICGRNGEGLELIIRISSGRTNKFAVLTAKLKETMIALYMEPSPFGDIGTRGVEDPRVPILAKYLAAKPSSSVDLERKVIMFRRICEK